MNKKLIVKILGIILLIEAAFMLPSLIISFYMKDSSNKGFLVAMSILIVLFLATRFIKIKDYTLAPLDGLFIVGFSWILVSIFGAIPLYINTELDFISSFFEIVSGFTTTGASVIGNIESYPKSVVFWRSITHWIGGMGILVFTVSILPRLGVGGFQIYKAESPGPVAGKIQSTTARSGKILYRIYLLITLIIFLALIATKMSVFDAAIHTFGVTGTGGFSSHNDSLTRYGTPTIVVLSIAMFICATNFNVYFLIYKRKFKEILNNDELKMWFLFIGIAVLSIAICLFNNGYGSFSLSLRDSALQVTSVSSTSGFANTDFDLWPSFAKTLLFLLYFMGGCAGSTAGGLKVVRITVLYKLVKREIKKTIHPKAVVPIRLNGKNLSEQVVLGICAFTAVYFFVFCISTAIITLDGHDIRTSMSAVATFLSNVGPGFSKVGPTKNFAFFSSGYKLYFSFLMLLGRLEFFTLIALISPSNPKKELIKI
ncbi:TrkH family potassium uptake protein [Lagierella massiliensis]|uniref:TrkH family potassium uptake protein n=1 Tax=Lagierella massiliensis TaxID=1689303 RepID=UPI0006D782F5|nr:TrkH family potassium uptake protein [Lagierella massiliensis]